jgi:hypothetical protein
MIEGKNERRNKGIKKEGTNKEGRNEGWRKGMK